MKTYGQQRVETPFEIGVDRRRLAGDAELLDAAGVGVGGGVGGGVGVNGLSPYGHLKLPSSLSHPALYAPDGTPFQPITSQHSVLNPMT